MRNLDYILIGVQIIEFIAIVYLYYRTKQLVLRHFELPPRFDRY
jgi:hypothetical protein